MFVHNFRRLNAMKIDKIFDRFYNTQLFTKIDIKKSIINFKFEKLTSVKYRSSQNIKYVKVNRVYKHHRQLSILYL